MSKSRPESRDTPARRGDDGYYPHEHEGPKSSAQREAARRERLRREMGLINVTVRVPVSDRDTLKAFAAKLRAAARRN